MAATVDPLLPLSFLEAVRDVDTPEGSGDADDTEYVAELRNKRFGLSDTVYAQIRRYTEAVRRNQRAPHAEVVAFTRLIGRRPDADEVFRAAGRHIAREAYLTISPVTRRMLRLLPTLVARPTALKQLRRIAHRYLGGSVRRVGTTVVLDVPESVTLDSAPRNAGCVYYEAALRELVQLLVAGGGAVEHVNCAGRGERSCQWRAEWRS